MFVGVFVFACFIFEVKFLFVVEVTFLFSFITPQNFVLWFRVGRLDLFTSCLGDHFDAFFSFVRLCFPLGFSSLVTSSIGGAASCVFGSFRARKVWMVRVLL